MREVCEGIPLSYILNNKRVSASAKPVQDQAKADTIEGRDLHNGVDESLNSAYKQKQRNHLIKKAKTIISGGNEHPSRSPSPRFPTLGGGNVHNNKNAECNMVGVPVKILEGINPFDYYW